MLRINSYKEDFEKDTLAIRLLQGAGVAIPSVLKIGAFNNNGSGVQYYCISEQAIGTTLVNFGTQKGTHEERSLAPQLFRILDRIHDTDVTSFDGWGLTDAQGRGRFSSWAEYLLSFYNQKLDFDWFTLSKTTFLDAKMFAACISELRRLIRYCPPKKWLIHGDFGFDNVITDGKTITGVLDWAEMRLGDYVYDVAYLDFWSKSVPYGDMWLDYARSKSVHVTYFDERMRCYMLYIGLSSMMIAAARNNEIEYKRIRERTRSVFGPSRRSPYDWL